jgi:hypothetical protein
MADQLSGKSSSSSTSAAQQTAVLGSLFGIDQNVVNLTLPAAAPQHGLSAVGSGPRPMTSVLQQVSAFYHLSSDERDTITQRLAAAGYLDLPVPDSKGKVKKLNPYTVQSAFKTAVLDAARSQMSVGELLDQRAQENGSGSGSSDPTQTRLSTNPLDVQALGQSAAQKGLGQNLTPEQLAQFQSKFQSTESPYLQSTATMSEPGSGGWAEWAQQQVREFDPKKFDARKVLSGVNVLADMLKNGGNLQSTIGSSNG